VFEAGLLDGSTADDLLKPVEADLLTNVELNQDQNRAGEVRSGRSEGWSLRRVTHEQSTTGPTSAE
jgi:hypothetical protein